MLRRISENIASEMISAGVITSEEKDIYQYSMELIIAMTVNLISSIALFAAFGRLLEGLTFLAAFLPLRTYSGGYHASNYVKCYILSIAVMVGFLFSITVVPADCLRSVALFITPMAALIMFILAPVESPNKPLDEKEYAVYRVISRRILAVEIILTALLLAFRLTIPAFIIACSMGTVALALICGEIDNLCGKETE